MTTRVGEWSTVCAWRREIEKERERSIHNKCRFIDIYIIINDLPMSPGSLWLPHTFTQKTNKTRLERRTKLEHNFICLLSLKMGSFSFIQWMMKNKTKSVIPQRIIIFFSGRRVEISSSIAFEMIAYIDVNKGKRAENWIFEPPKTEIVRCEKCWWSNSINYHHFDQQMRWKLQCMAHLI